MFLKGDHFNVIVVLIIPKPPALKSMHHLKTGVGRMHGN